MQTKAKEGYKHQIEFLPYLSYHHTPGSTINITLAGTKQKKAELLGPYGKYFERFKSQLPMPSEFQSLPLQPDFRTASPWKITESKGEQEEEEKEESEDQEFTYQNPITENLEFEILNL
ncbi:hypothetical protein G9A89_006252 [Geosiphon pyriformis]|nr:hypothetical protein G9A89_006252 [Geosiphon pyriformis]